MVREMGRKKDCKSITPQLICGADKGHFKVKDLYLFDHFMIKMGATLAKIKQ